MRIINEYGYITYEPKPMMEYGFIDIAKNEWHHTTADAYNGYTKEINSIKPHQARSMTDAEREKMLDNRHKFYVSIMYALIEKKAGADAT